jgi:hypothetical protein
VEEQAISFSAVPWIEESKATVTVAKNPAKATPACLGRLLIRDGEIGCVLTAFGGCVDSERYAPSRSNVSKLDSLVLVPMEEHIGTAPRPLHKTKTLFGVVYADYTTFHHLEIS